MNLPDTIYAELHLQGPAAREWLERNAPAGAVPPEPCVASDRNSQTGAVTFRIASTAPASWTPEEHNSLAMRFAHALENMTEVIPDVDDLIGGDLDGMGMHIANTRIPA